MLRIVLISAFIIKNVMGKVDEFLLKSCFCTLHVTDMTNTCLQSLTNIHLSLSEIGKKEISVLICDFGD